MKKQKLKLTKAEKESQIDYETDMRYEKWREAQEVRAELLVKYGEANTDE